LNPPDWLDQDFQRVIRSTGHNAPDLEERLNEETKATQAFARAYAAGLEDWCAAWEYCRGQSIESLLDFSAS
jgi:hypothetical protein